jgi:acyl-homoserine lactone acylase PvdQ
MVSISLCTATQAYEGTRLVADARRVLAVVSGTLRVPGLRKPVRVLRDQWGVAHIYAENQHDLFFAQGVVAAQDRPGSTWLDPGVRDALPKHGPGTS